MIFEKDQVSLLKKELSNKKVVFTNGCFDILHRGHVDYLNKAKNLADVLVLGLNTDASVQRLKGMSRPVTKESDRAFMLDNLKAVDFVILFEEDTPLKLITELKPDVLVKGNDYKDKLVVGQEFVEKNGGTVQLIEFIDGYSTSSFIEKIRKLEKN